MPPEPSTPRAAGRSRPPRRRAPRPSARRPVAAGLTRWRIIDSALVWRSWPGELERVVYSPRSASVHLVNLSAWRLLELLTGAPRSEPELAAALAGERGAPVDDELLGAVSQIVAGLDAAGLITPESL